MKIEVIKKMKRKWKIILFIMSLIPFNVAKAQVAKSNTIYATGELNLGNYVGADLNLNYVLNEKYSFKLGYTGNFRKPKSQPNDFSSGVTGLLIFRLNSPVDKIETIGASVGRIYKLNQRGTIRLNFSLGVGYTLITEPENWTKINNNVVSLTKNYAYDNVEHKAVSLLINPKIEFPITRYFGFTISPLLQINKDRTYVGIGFGSMIGFLR